MCKIDDSDDREEKEKEERERESNRNDEWRENNRDNFYEWINSLVFNQFYTSFVSSFVSHHIFFNFRSRFFESHLDLCKLRKEKRKIGNYLCTGFVFKSCRLLLDIYSNSYS